MYAIVEIAGKQFRVAKDQNLKVPRLEAESGSKVQFDKVLFYADDSGKNQLGKPAINNMTISATVVEHGRDKKIVVFKKKRRKGYQVKNGHRQDFSVIKIDKISATKKAEKTEAKKAEPKVAVKEEKPKAKTTAKPKTTAQKKASPAKKAAPKAKAEKTVKPKAKPSEKKEA